MKKFLILLLSLTVNFAWCDNEILQVVDSQRVPLIWGFKERREYRARSHDLSQQFKTEMSSGDNTIVAGRANAAVGGAIRRAVQKLHEVGKHELAEKILKEWEEHYDGFVYEIAGRASDYAISDHPAIEWLLGVYNELTKNMTPAAIRLSRLSDIWFLAYCIPVVFTCVDKVSRAEYELHWSRMVSIVGYWVADLACTAGTSLVFICPFVAIAVEQVSLHIIGPRTVGPMWKWACNTRQ